MVGAPDQPGGGAAGDPTHALFADQSQSIPDNLVSLLGQIRAWNYLADTARSAGSLFASQRVRKLNRARRTRWHPVGGGSLNRLAPSKRPAPSHEWFRCIMPPSR